MTVTSHPVLLNFQEKKKKKKRRKEEEEHDPTKAKQGFMISNFLADQGSDDDI